MNSRKVELFVVVLTVNTCIDMKIVLEVRGSDTYVGNQVREEKLKHNYIAMMASQ